MDTVGQTRVHARCEYCNLPIVLLVELTSSPMLYDDNRVSIELTPEVVAASGCEHADGYMAEKREGH